MSNIWITDKVDSEDEQKYDNKVLKADKKQEKIAEQPQIIH